MQTNTRPLSDLWVMVTRPVHQAGALCNAIRAAGGHAIRWPTIAIAEPDDLGPARHVIDRLKTFDVAIFISSNAAQQGIDLIRAQQQSLDHPTVLAVGAGTAGTLFTLGISEVRHPECSSNSEGVLAMRELSPTAVAGKRIVIFRGQGGRELLANTLRQRGAEVVYAEVYRRIKPKSDPEIVEAYWDRGRLDIIIVTSRDGLQNLVELLGKQLEPKLLDSPLLVVGPRMAEQARELGFHVPPIVVDRADDAEIVRALISRIAS